MPGCFMRLAGRTLRILIGALRAPFYLLAVSGFAFNAVRFFLFALSREKQSFNE
jgi:hypothetical protein